MRGLAFALICLAGAARAEEVVWMLPVVAPAVIVDGPFAGLGGSEAGRQVLEKALPQFQWRYETAAPLRVIHEIEQRDGVCAPGMGKTPEREGLMLFNNRPGVSPGYGVILREDRLAEFQRFLDADGAFDLDRLAEAKNLSGGYPAGRPRYGSLKDFVEKNPDRLTGDTDTNRLFRQLKAKHLDYVLGLRDEAFYFATLGEEVKLVSLPLAGMPRFGKAYIACSKGPIGQAAMAAIDAYFADDAHWAASVGPWARWLSPDDFAALLKSPVIRPAPSDSMSR